MRRLHKLFAGGFAAGLSLGVILWWLAGFDFDRRGPDVMIGAILALVAGAAGAALSLTTFATSKDFQD